MSKQQLLKIQEELLELDIQELEDFILELSSKTYQKKQQQSHLPDHIREGIRESLEEIEDGKFIDVLPTEDISIIKSIEKMKKINNVHTS
jgi:ribosomal protein L7Ae-like RNA K-turn-binding protein